MEVTTRAWKRRNWRGSGIRLEYKNYDGYPEYEQIASPFVPDVSIVDLSLMKGTSAPEYIWGELRQR